MKGWIDFTLFLIFLISVILTVYFSEKIASIFKRDKFHLLELYAVSAAIAFMAVTAVALVISGVFNKTEVATELLVAHFSSNVKKEIIVIFLSPLLKLLKI